MSTILQPCLESQFIERATVKLKVAPPYSMEFVRSPSPAAAEAKENTEKMESGGWSFLQVLSKISSTPKETMEKETVYVHPMARRSSSPRLSEKSLELCTENLGCETGTDIMDSSILSLSSSCYTRKFSAPCVQEKQHKQQMASKNYKVTSRSFPPPLTTISGANPIQVRPHREGGRLVIRAVEGPVRRAYLQAQRSQGRLRLTLLKDHANFDSEATEEENEVNSESKADVDVERESDIEDEDRAENEELDHDQSDEDEDEDEDEEGEEASGTQMLSNDMDGNNFDIEVEKGKKFQRLRRCNEGGHGNKSLCSWEPVWVATS